MDVSTSCRHTIITPAILVLGAVFIFLPQASCDRGYRFIASPADDFITLAPLSNGWRPVVSTATWRQQTTTGARHPVHSRVQQHLRSSETRKKAQVAESNKVEVFAPAPPSILGSFSLVSKPRRHKVAEQEELLPQGRIVYSARLVPPPVQTSLSGSSRDQHHAGLTPPPKSSSAIHYSRPSSLELYPSYLSNYEDSRPAVSSNAFSSSGHGIYLDPSHNLPNQQAFKTLPDSINFFKDFFDKHKAAYAEALSAQKLLDKQKSQPVIESVELGKEVFYGKDVSSSPFANFNDYSGKFLSPFSIKNPGEVEIVHAKRPETGLYSTPAPENFNYNNLPSRGTTNYKYQAGVLTTPFSNPSHVYTSPTPSPLIQPTFPTNNLLNPTSTLSPPVQNEFKLSPVQFVPPTSVSLQPQGENGRIPRPYHHDKRVNENVLEEVFPVTNGHAPAQHTLHKPAAVYNDKDSFVTFLPTIPPEMQTVAPEQGYEGLTSPHSILNEVTPIPSRGKVIFKQSPLDPLSSQTPLTSIDSFETRKPDRPFPTLGYKESEQMLFGTQTPETLTFTSEVSTAEPTKDPFPSDISRPRVRTPDRNRQRLKPSRRPSNNVGSPELNNVQRQRNPQRTRQSTDNTRHLQSQQDTYFSSTPSREESTFENDQNVIPPRNHRPHVDTDTRINDMEIDDSENYPKTKPNRMRRPPARQNENDLSEESSTQDNMHSSTQAYYTRGPDAQKLVRGNLDSEGTEVQEQSAEKEVMHSSRRPGSQVRLTRPQQSVRNEPPATRSPHHSRRRPQSQRDNPDVKDNGGYQNIAYQGTRTHHPRRPSSNRGQASYYTNNGYDGVRGRPNQRQRPTKHEITDTTEVEEESERQTVSSVQNNRNQASYSQTEADNTKANPHSRRRKPSNTNYNHADHQDEATWMNHQTNDDILPSSLTLTNELTSQVYSTTVRPTRRHPPTQRINEEKYSVSSGTHTGENNDVPVTRMPSHDSELNYDHAESYEHSYHTNYKAGLDNTYSTNYEHKNIGKGKNSAVTEDENANELSFDTTTTVEPVRTSTSTTTTTAPTTTSAAITTTSTTTTSTTSAIPTTTETEAPLETSTATATSTSTNSHSSLFVPSKLRPRLRPGTNSSRPRFSIKDYRQRLNKQSEGEAQDDDVEKNDDEKSSGTYQARYPSRTRGSESYRRESGGTTSTTTESSRSRYRSDRPRTSTRFRTTTTTTRRPDQAASTEKTGSFRPNTSRFKPGTGKFYSRYRISTASSADKPEDESTSSVSSTTPRILMNPKGVFSAMRRIYPLKMLSSGQKNTTAKEESTKSGMSDVVHTLPPTFVITPLSSSTEVPTSSSTTEQVAALTATSLGEHVFFQNSHGGVETNVLPSATREDGWTSTPGSVEIQSPSQIVAGLTSAGAASGLFKSASSLSSRPALSITMATEEPRLPIEAFFPVLTGKD